MKKCSLSTMVLYIVGLSVMTAANECADDHEGKFIPAGQVLNKACSYWNIREYCLLENDNLPAESVASVRQMCQTTCKTCTTSEPCVDNTEKFEPGNSELNKACSFWIKRGYCENDRKDPDVNEDDWLTRVTRVRQECPVSCGACDGAQPTAPPGPDPTAPPGPKPTDPSVTCVNTKTDTWCNERMDKCNQSNISNKCKKTCGECTDTGPGPTDPPKPCVDNTEKFEPGNSELNKACSFWLKRGYCENDRKDPDVNEDDWLTRVTRVRQECPLSCGACDGAQPTAPPGPDPTAPPGPKPTDPPVTCVNTKTDTWCNERMDKCNQSNISNKCKKTCGECTDPTDPPVSCENTKSDNFCNKFMSKCGNNAHQKKCQKACDKCPDTGPDPTDPPVSCANTKADGWCKTRIRKCGNKKIQKQCKKTCGKCPDTGPEPTDSPSTSPTTSPSARPTTSPSASPTASPSASPTASPSASPTSTPSTSPTSTPSDIPTKAKCTLTGQIAFPETNVLGYHASTLRVTRDRWNTVCSTKKRRTKWGCVHLGNAQVGNWQDEEPCNDVETATIEDAETGVGYEFTMQHIFDPWEQYYQGKPSDNDGDDDIVGVLTVSANGVDIGNFNYPKNKGRDTHTIDGSINGEFRDLVFVDVVCDENCGCTATKRLPRCHIRAEVRHPSVKAMKELGLEGYHNDAISVTKKTQESCSKTSPLTKWCVHEGDAVFYQDTLDNEEDIYYDRSFTESIVIPEGANSSFTFYVEHDIPPEEEDFVGGNELTGAVHLFTNYEQKDTYDHWFKNSSVFSESFFLDVDCNADCKCITKKRAEIKCKVSAKVEFLEENLNENYGYHKDDLTVRKSGLNELCNYDNEGNRTSWGCLHDGNDAEIMYTYDKKTNTTNIVSTTESAWVPGAASGDYRFILEHYSTPKELKYPNDHKLYSTMSISINDREPQHFSYPKNRKTDTHLPNGSPNPEYKGKAIVDVKCDGYCDCTIEQQSLKCEVDAVLSFPNNTDYYEYNADTLTVTKEGSDEKCGYYDDETDWGCMHYGDAVVEDYEDDNYYDYASTASVNIPDASDGIYNFTVEYYASNEIPSTEFDNSELIISVGGNYFGSYTHIRNTDTPTHNEDGSINEDYTSDMTVIMSCDDSCNCAIEV